MLPMPSLGIILAFVALIGWGFGDFFIQRTARSIGSLRALFFIAAGGSLILLPFVAREIPEILTASSPIWILTVTSALGLFPALGYFEGLREGKMSVIEPILSLELPITIGLGVVIHGEHVSLGQALAIALVFVGIILIVTKRRPSLGRVRVLERGVLFAIAAACGLGLGNFIVGISSQNVGPVLTIWFTHTCFALYCFFLLAARRELGGLGAALLKAKAKVGAQVAFDLTAWLSFATATTLVPISIATTISESYIVLASLLGLYVNRERIKTHQALGMACAAGGAILLSYLAG